MKAVKIVHPHHPLSGQIVRLVQQTTHPFYLGRHWIIEVDDQTHIYVPLAWAVPVESLDEDPATTPTDDVPTLLVDIPSLLRLVRMVSQLLTLSQTEEPAHETLPDADPSSVTAAVCQPPVTTGATPMGTATTGLPTRAGHDAGDAVGQTTAHPDASTAGESR